MRRKILMFGLLLIIVVVFAAAFFSLSGRSRRTGAGLFCWEEEVLERKDLREALFRTMEQYDMDQLYQYIPDDKTSEEISPFLQEAADAAVEVYLLAGDPSWAYDKTGQDLIGVLKQAERIRTESENGSALKGVMADVEPYLSGQWEQNEADAMGTYVAAMEAACEYADETSLFLYACIPYFYDSEGLTEYLELLAKDGCHGLAVMNYYREEEAAHLEQEWSLAKRYGKPVINIYELQKPGTHDLTEKNTYYESGMEGVRESFGRLQETLPYSGLTYAVHDYRALLEVEKIE